MNKRNAALQALLEGTLDSEHAALLVREAAADADFAKEYCAALKVLSCERSLQLDTSQPSDSFTDVVMHTISEEREETEAVSIGSRILHNRFVDWLCEMITPTNMRWAVTASTLFVTSALSYSVGTWRAPQLVPLAMGEVLIPRTDIAPGTPLTAALFEKRFIPLMAIPSQAIRTEEELVGQVAAHLIVGGYALDRRYARTDFTKFAPGYRVVAVQLDDQSALYVRLGDPIQLVANVRDQDGDSRATQITREGKVMRLEVRGETEQRVAYVAVPEADATRIDTAKEGVTHWYAVKALEIPTAASLI